MTGYPTTSIPEQLVQGRLRWRADQRLPYYPTEGMGRPGAPLPTVSLGLRTMEKGLGKLTQDRRVWGASILDVVNSISDAGSTRPG